MQTKGFAVNIEAPGSGHENAGLHPGLDRTLYSQVQHPSFSSNIAEGYQPLEKEKRREAPCPSLQVPCGLRPRRAKGAFGRARPRDARPQGEPSPSSALIQE